MLDRSGKVNNGTKEHSKSEPITVLTTDSMIE